MLYFWADWCEPCKAFKPTFKAVAKDYPNVSFATIDTESEVKLAQDFDIRSIPTIIILRGHVALCKESGVLTGPALEDLIKQASDLDMHAVNAKIAKKMSG